MPCAADHSACATYGSPVARKTAPRPLLKTRGQLVASERANGRQPVQVGMSQRVAAVAGEEAADGVGRAALVDRPVQSSPISIRAPSTSAAATAPLPGRCLYSEAARIPTTSPSRRMVNASGPSDSNSPRAASTISANRAG